MNLRLYKFFGIICFLPIWVFRGNLNYIEIIFVISLFFILPILMAVIMFMTQKLAPPMPGQDPTTAAVMKFMPINF